MSSTRREPLRIFRDRLPLRDNRIQTKLRIVHDRTNIAAIYVNIRHRCPFLEVIASVVESRLADFMRKSKAFCHTVGNDNSYTHAPA